MDISVIICTYNRAESLRRTLQTCCDLVIPAGVTWELLVVDNNSNDHTKQVCESFTGKLPIRYLFESRPGKSNALNRSIQEANSELLLFTDDDVELDKNWLQAYAEASTRHPTAAFFGGKVLPKWEGTPPRWAVENLAWLDTNVHIDRGEQELPITDLMKTGDMPFFVGANITFRRECFGHDLRFQEDIGPTGADHTVSGNFRGEEIDIEERLLAQGHVGIYVPSSVVRHYHTLARQTESYVRKYYFGAGVASVRLTKNYPDGCYWFGTPRYMWKRLILSVAKYLCTRLWAKSRTWLAAEKTMACTLGAICEHRRLRQANPLA
jgi:glucosyl-dolichyl phosphate glucuronosyltransferase